MRLRGFTWSRTAIQTYTLIYTRGHRVATRLNNSPHTKRTMIHLRREREACMCLKSCRLLSLCIENVGKRTHAACRGAACLHLHTNEVNECECSAGCTCNKHVFHFKTKTLYCSFSRSVLSPWPCLNTADLKKATRSCSHGRFLSWKRNDEAKKINCVFSTFILKL